MKPISVKQFVVTLSASETNQSEAITFNKCTAPETSYGTFEATDPTLGVVETYTEFSKASNITLTKHFEGEGDPLVGFYNVYRVTGTRPLLSVTIQPVLPDSAGTPYPGSQPIQLLRCKIVRVQHAPAVDRDGTGSGVIELELAVGEIK